MKKSLISGFIGTLIFLLPIIGLSEGIYIIPKPMKVIEGKGAFLLDKSTIIIVPKESGKLLDVAAQCVEGIRKYTGIKVAVKETPLKNELKNVIILKSLTSSDDFNKEGYRLSVAKDRILIESSSPAGIFYGIQSLLQLIPTEKQRSGWPLQAVTIEDQPRFTWRGMHLDVSRHFFTKEFIKTYIDMLAMHKMNVFHWHLTDDQGWRIEIKKYPKLTAVGAWRVDRENIPVWDFRDMNKEGEKATYGGYYTQDEISEIVQYAESKFITIVPEIEMPAHAKAVLAAYPQLSCTGGPFTVQSGGCWPITDIFCAGNDSSFVLLQDVLNEVIDLFPGNYIHIGGDEASKEKWIKCPKCQLRIKSEGLKDEAELQSYFVKRIEKYIISRNRKLIGWDEILEGGLAPEATVMSWRGTEGGIAAARQGHDVVMTPMSHCYFNTFQGNPGFEPLVYPWQNLPISKVYVYEPIPDSLTKEESKHVLGAQGDVWSEYVATPAEVQYMALPRIAAMAEVIWSPKEARNWPDFSTRIEDMMKRYEIQKWNYSKSAYQVSFMITLDSVNKQAEIAMAVEMTPLQIRYTLDGSQPMVSSQEYSAPVKISKTTTLKASAFRNDKMIGVVSEQKFVFDKASFKSVRIKYPFEKLYNKENNSMTNTLRGTKDYKDGNWQEYRRVDFEAVVDLGEVTSFSKISAGFLQNTPALIFLPTQVEYAVSENDTNYVVVGNFSAPVPQKNQEIDIKEYTQELVNGRARYIRIIAKNVGICPQWHSAKGSPAMLCIDEIVVN